MQERPLNQKSAAFVRMNHFQGLFRHKFVKCVFVK